MSTEKNAMSTKAVAVGIGTLLTLLLWIVAFAVLVGFYSGNLPWLLTGLVAILCPLCGGFVTARVSQTRDLRLGALSGASAGSAVLLTAALASHLAPNTTLASIGLVVVGALSGGLGTTLSAKRLTWVLGLATVIALVGLFGARDTQKGLVQPTAAPSLVGTKWALTSLNGSALIQATEITLHFEETYLGGKMTCNGYGGGPDSGKYIAATDGTFAVPQLAVTVQLCSSPKGVMEQEKAYVDALLKTATYQVIGERLEIADDGGNVMLVYARMEYGSTE